MSLNPRQTWLTFSRTRIGRVPHERLVAGIELARSVEGMDRQRWLYRNAESVPAGNRFQFRDARPPTAGDLDLCERLVAAHTAATASAPPAEGMWAEDLFEERQSALTRPLADQDARSLAFALAEMFRTDVVLGMAAGSLGAREQTRLSRRVSWLNTVGKLVALGEALGAVRVENPEQGGVAVGLADGPDAVVTAIQSVLGLSIDFPEVGAAYGVLAAGRLITPDTPDQLYGAHRLLEAVQLHLEKRAAVSVVEIGGGYGGMAYWLLRMRELPYTIVDLPLVNVIQGYFLAKALGADAVRLYGERGKATVTVLPDHALEDIEGPVDVVVNKDSMPEIPLTAVKTYLEWTKRNCTGILYSYNQEAGAEFHGTAQNVVPEVVAQIGGFTRIRREPSWLRRGYAEEIYRPSPEDSRRP